MRWIGCVGAFLLASAAPAADPPNWNQPTAPFRILGNVYYVGSAGLSAFLVTGPQGHVLVDGGTPECAPLILASIAKLGFRARDIRYILLNHAHFDHAGGLAALRRASGAKIVVGAGDRAEVEAGGGLQRPDLDRFPPVHVDRVVTSGDRVAVGPLVLTALATPGHTAGATSWQLETAGRHVVFASSLTVAGEKLVGNPAYPQAERDFRATFARLRNVRADVFLNFHSEGFDLDAKRARLEAGDPAAFVDPGELARRVDAAERDFAAEDARQHRAAG